MFQTFWEPAAFDRMQSLVREHPGLKAGFAYTLSSLSTELAESADIWGESREGNLRLGYVGVVSVLVRVDANDRTVRIVDVRLESRTRPG
jgi:hypothetical protein